MTIQRYTFIQQNLTIFGVVLIIVAIASYTLTHFTAGGCWGNGHYTFSVTQATPSNIVIERGCVRPEVNGVEYESNDYEETGLFQAPPSLFGKLPWTMRGTLKNTDTPFSANGIIRYDLTYIILTLLSSVGFPLGVAALFLKLVVLTKKPRTQIPAAPSQNKNTTQL